MRNGEGGPVPIYNVQLLTDVSHGLVVNLEANCDSIDFFFFSSRRRHTRFKCDWSSDVCSSDLHSKQSAIAAATQPREMPVRVGPQEVVQLQPRQLQLTVPVSGVVQAVRSAVVKEIGRASCRERV